MWLLRLSFIESRTWLLFAEAGSVGLHTGLKTLIADAKPYIWRCNPLWYSTEREQSWMAWGMTGDAHCEAWPRLERWCLTEGNMCQAKLCVRSSKAQDDSWSLQLSCTSKLGHKVSLMSLTCLTFLLCVSAANGWQASSDAMQTFQDVLSRLYSVLQVPCCYLSWTTCFCTKSQPASWPVLHTGKIRCCRVNYARTGLQTIEAKN